MAHSRASIDDRKRRVLETMAARDAPIWLGDLAPRASEYGMVGEAFRQLVREGAIEKCRPNGPQRYRRVYYRLIVKPGGRGPRGLT